MRSIKKAVGAVIKENKAHFIFDKELCVLRTIFTRHNKITKYENKMLVGDITEGGVPISDIGEVDPKTMKLLIKNVDCIGFSRDPYLTSANELFDVVRKLSKRAYSIFKYIIDNIDFNHNYIVLTTKDIGEIINSTNKCTISNYLNELIKANLIAKANSCLVNDAYTINHNLFFKGSYNNFIYKYNKIYGECDDRKNADD